MRTFGKPALTAFALSLLLAVSGCVSMAPLVDDQAAITLKQRLEPTTQTRLRAVFAGVSTIGIEDNTASILVDGFFSRPTFSKLLFGELSPYTDLVDLGLRRTISKPLSAILVAHAHHDHAMDAGYIAMITGAPVLGNDETVRIVRASHPNSGSMTIEGNGSVLPFGPFAVQAFSTQHSHPNLMSGSVPENVPDRLTFKHFRTEESLVFSIVHSEAKVLVVASVAPLDAVLEGVSADVVFLGIASLQRQPEGFIERYWCRAVTMTGAKVVVPIHWDNFFKPVGTGLEPMFGAPWSFRGMLEDLQRLARRDGVGLVVLDGFEGVDLSAAAALPEPQGDPATLPCE